MAQGFAVDVVNFWTRKYVIENSYRQLLIIQNMIGLKFWVATDYVCRNGELMVIFLLFIDAFVR